MVALSSACSPSATSQRAPAPRDGARVAGKLDCDKAGPEGGPSGEAGHDRERVLSSLRSSPRPEEPAVTLAAGISTWRGRYAFEARGADVSRPASRPHSGTGRRAGGLHGGGDHSRTPSGWAGPENLLTLSRGAGFTLRTWRETAC